MKMPIDERGLGYREIRRITEEVALREHDREQWPVHGNGVERFDRVFRRGRAKDYLDMYDVGFLRESMKDIVRQRRESGMPTKALDIMGDGTLLRELGVEGGLSVCLQDTRSDEVRQEDETKHLEVLGGDLLRKQTWREISAWMNRHNVPAFDYIVSMPFGGLIYLPKGDVLIKKGIEELYKRLSPNGGRMYLQIAQYFVAHPEDGFRLFDGVLDESVRPPSGYSALVPEDASHPTSRTNLAHWVESLLSRYPKLHIQLSAMNRSGGTLTLEVIRTPESPQDLFLDLGNDT